MQAIKTLRGALCAGFVAVSAFSAAKAETLPEQVNTIYDLYLGGIKAGELTIDAKIQGDRYAAQSIMHTAGVVGFFYKASFEAEIEGTVTPEGLVPIRFAAASRMKDKEQFVEMLYGGGGAPSTVNAEPAFIPKPWQIDPAEQIGTMDPISAALAALSPRPLAEMCNRTVEVFDGRRRYAIDLGDPVPDGKRIKCEANYRRIAGFKPKMMKKRPNFPFNIWLEDRPDGLTHVVRGAGDSMFGLAVILLRK